MRACAACCAALADAAELLTNRPILKYELRGAKYEVGSANYEFIVVGFGRWSRRCARL